MKTYEKPRLIALSLSSDDMLCSGCGNKLPAGVIENLLTDNGIIGWDTDHNGSLSDSEADAAGLFGTGETCTQGIVNYCKFTATDNPIFQS